MKQIIAVLLFACGLATAQVNPPTIWKSSRTTPSGNCAAGTGVETIPGGVLYTCQAGTWVQVSGAGGASIAPFTTDGTNVTLPTSTLSVGNTVLGTANKSTDIATPANPTAGVTAWYTKAGKLCSLSPAGVENCTGTSATIASTTSVLKGDNAGNAVAATANTDYLPVANPASTGIHAILGLSYPAVTVAISGATGSAGYTYCVVGTDSGGFTRSICNGVSTGFASDDATHYQTVTVAAWSSTAPYTFPVGSCNVYRTGGGATIGIIGTIANCASGGSIQDKAVVGDTTTPPVDTSGSISIAGGSKTGLILPITAYPSSGTPNPPSAALTFMAGYYEASSGGVFPYGITVQENPSTSSNYLDFKATNTKVAGRTSYRFYSGNGSQAVILSDQAAGVDLDTISTGNYSFREVGTADGATFTLVGGGARYTFTGGIITGAIQSNGTQNVSGCTLSGAVGGASAGSFISGTTGTCTVVITPGSTAPNGWACTATDITTGAALPQTAYNATTCTIAGATTSTNVVVWRAMGF